MIINNKAEFDKNVKLIFNIIENKKNNIPYLSSNLVAKQKYLCYQAIENLLNSQPENLIKYILGSRSGGFQSKIFQEYIFLLEKSIPFTFSKCKKNYIVSSLLDEKLSLFDGISSFEGIIDDKLFIKNNTKEFYIGGRTGSISQPYYIGKILNILDKDTKLSLLDNLCEYSFLRIKMKNISPGTEVIVNHLRVPPHYQMGGMVYVNRVRKEIVDSIENLL